MFGANKPAPRTPFGKNPLTEKIYGKGKAAPARPMQITPITLVKRKK